MKKASGDEASGHRVVMPWFVLRLPDPGSRLPVWLAGAGLGELGGDGDELVEGDGFEEVAVYAEGCGVGLVAFALVGGEHDDGGGGGCALDFFEHEEAGFAREHHVEDDDVGGGFLHGGDGFVAVGRAAGDGALGGEDGVHGFEDVFVVVDEDHFDVVEAGEHGEISK